MYKLKKFIDRVCLFFFSLFLFFLSFTKYFHPHFQTKVSLLKRQFHNQFNTTTNNTIMIIHTIVRHFNIKALHYNRINNNKTFQYKILVLYTFK